MGSFERFTTKARFNSLKRLVLFSGLAALAVKLVTTAVATAASDGSPLAFALRIPASLADLAAALLVFEILRARRSQHLAARSAVLVGASPVLLVASGVHGDRTSVAALGLLTAAWLVVDREAPLAAGLALAVAVRVAPLALVAVPVVLAAAAWPASERRSTAGRVRGSPGQVVGAFVTATVAAWAPALAWGWQPLEVAGPAPAGDPAAFGPGWLAGRLGAPQLAELLAGPLRMVPLAAAVLAAVVWVRRRPRRAYAAVGLALVALVALDPVWSPRDLVWPLVFGYLGDSRWATIYAAVAGATLLWTSTVWDRGLPWAGPAGGQAGGATAALGLATWAVLLVWLGLGLRTVTVERGHQPAAATRPPEAPAEEPPVPVAAGRSSRSAPLPK
jgi:hypothetical protein